MNKTMRIACLLSSGLFALAACSGDREKNGNAQVAPPPDVSLASCTDLWTVAYREERGPDVIVSTDQLAEWQAWCKEGKTPIESAIASSSVPAPVVSAPAVSAPVALPFIDPAPVVSAPVAPVRSARPAVVPPPVAPAPAVPVPAPIAAASVAPAPAEPAPVPAAPAPAAPATSASTSAGMDAAAIEPYLRKQGCMKCHAIDKEKKGPSYKKVAAKYAGKPNGETDVIKNMTQAPKVKLDDGTEEEHKVIDTKDQGDLKAISKWILSR